MKFTIGEWRTIVDNSAALMKVRFVAEKKCEVYVTLRGVEHNGKGAEVKCAAGQAVAAVRDQLNLAMTSLESAAKLLPVNATVVSCQVKGDADAGT